MAAEGDGRGEKALKPLDNERRQHFNICKLYTTEQFPAMCVGVFIVTSPAVFVETEKGV